MGTHYLWFEKICDNPIWIPAGHYEIKLAGGVHANSILQRNVKIGKANLDHIVVVDQEPKSSTRRQREVH